VCQLQLDQTSYEPRGEGRRSTQATGTPEARATRNGEASPESQAGERMTEKKLGGTAK